MTLREMLCHGCSSYDGQKMREKLKHFVYSMKVKLKEMREKKRIKTFS